MMRVSRLAALAAIALSVRASAALASSPDHPELGVAAAVRAVSVLPADGHADVVIVVDGTVDVRDFTLPSPHRVVLDIKGARLGVPARRGYDGVPRGGIRNLRMSQFNATVVRVVLELDGPREYVVTRDGADVRISVTGAGDFAAWRAGVPAPAQKVATAPTTPAAESAVVAVEPPAIEPPAVAPATLPGQTAVSAATTPEPRMERVSAPRAPVRAETVQSRPRPRITVTYEDADVRDVLAAFAAFAGRTIVAGRDVKGEVTAEIKDQPWDVALQAILNAHGLAASEDGSGIITVDSYANILAKQASEPLATQLVPVNYVTAGSLVQTVETLLSRDCSAAAAAQPGQQPTCIVRGRISADSATNALLVTEVPSRMADLVRYIQSLDVRTPQVSIKARIISVNRTQTEQLGLSYDLASSGTFFNTLLPGGINPSTGKPATGEALVEMGGNALAGIANASRKYRNGASVNLIYSTMLGKFSLTAFLDALSEQNLSDVQAEPQITTLDNRTAKVLVGQETPVRVIDAGSAAGGGVPPRANVQFKETGIILEVTPHITNNRQILMNVYAEQSQLQIVGGDLGFFTDKRNARSQVLVGDGETAVIGGLTQTIITRNRSGIPLLSELPLIGRLFSQTDTREEKEDLLILLTPHIVDEGERAPGDR